MKTLATNLPCTAESCCQQANMDCNSTTECSSQRNEQSEDWVKLDKEAGEDLSENETDGTQDSEGFVEEVVSWEEGEEEPPGGGEMTISEADDEGGQLSERTAEQHENNSQVMQGQVLAAGKDVTLSFDGNGFSILAARPLEKGAEVFTTYGPIAGSGLLYEFGFVSDDNPYDVVRLDTEDLATACSAEFGEKTVRSNLRKFQASGGELTEHLELFSSKYGLHSEMQLVVHAMCGGGQDESRNLTAREQSALATALEMRDAKYGRKGGAAADRQGSADAAAEGRLHKALALQLAAAERSILADWMSVLRRGHKRQRPTC
eukprot:gnl/TRDRNA2_/TRDRNA2_158517_c2_seq3.p1 gnl/TRDRNA2_/TRDRNA2_158517_c2~~gnl/TRDRNA2_/TRDRNA2_158517_c2_seq3.p1  ORF type:complete len:319 (-),score=66.52 gnl/TRDRNA2_/TRDRNA2_158517_c2_seq3:58-1014(-)